jgi:tetratricopeptide (TPR) repeat protein
VVEAYDPVHPQVQEAAGIMINILINQGDLFDAERYAQVTYGNLRDKKNGIDQESEVVAVGAYNLANVLYRQDGDLIKAEELARESLRIRTLIYGSNNYAVEVSWSCDLLAGILMTQGKLGDETRGLFERYLAFSIRNHGPDGKHTAVANSNLGSLCFQLVQKENTVDLIRMQLILAKTYYVEALRIYSKIDGPTHPNTIDASSRLSLCFSIRIGVCRN